MTLNFDDYLKALAATPIDAKTEHTDRGALERLLKDAAADADTRLHVRHEPRGDKDGGGRPDFMVKRDARVVGYVENKQIDDSLDKLIRSDQIKKYQRLSENLLLTDYLEFVWLKKGQDPQRARLAHSTDLSGKMLALKPEATDQVAKLLRAFFSTAPQNIGRGQTLAVELATRAALLRDFLTEELVRQQKDNDLGKLHGLYAAFRDQIFHDLDIKAFADAFAQMLAYGLFLARLNAGAGVEVTLDNVRKFIPGSFSLIRELVRFLEEMDEPEYRPSRWVVDEILSIVNGIDLASIHNDLSFRARKAISRKIKAGDEEEHRLFEKDPFIYFYEDFLKAYDPAMRKGRGVYYTPPPVVNFIVRAIDDILKDTFGIADGLADHKRVTVLDFATGTGTFLLEVFERIFDTIGGPEAGKADGIVREHLTKNIYGFEYLIAPYTIAHLKLSQYLRDKGHPLQDQERLQVFLTNTLEPVEPQGNLLMPALAEEVKGAQEVKDKPILVITGNPPYSGHSKNTGAWITASIAEYRKGFPELSKPAQGKWLQDDYVKFIRFAQMKMDSVDEGVVGIITNHSWLDNPTFKGMRKSLLETFDQIHVLDLHGSTKKKERAPDGSADENVFDISQGVSVTIFIKRSGINKGVFHSDLWGKRLAKYQALVDRVLSVDSITSLSPADPDWLFRPHDEAGAARYREHPSIREIFAELGDPAPGFVTTHDQFAISFSPDEARGKVATLLASASEAEARKHFRLCTQEQWSYERAKSELPTINLADETTPILYRPFDRRWTIWDRNVAVHRRERVMGELRKGTLALVTSRMTKGEDFRHAQVSDMPIEAICMSPLTSNNGFAFPLYKDGVETFGTTFRDFLDARYGEHYDPEQILGYIYAILHAPTYRTRYAEFLRIDFPRIPFAETPEQFEALSALGWALIQTHLLKTVPRSKPRLGDYTGKGDHTVEAVRYSPEEQTVWINKTQGFANLPQGVWDFHIGGYQVIDKYLKSRKGRVLNLDEQTHVGNIAESLSFTISQMARIDAEYLKAFPSQ
ncbi:type ISP restriction/modification enzyme [Brevundimonas sp. SORGH_AS_0993]|uniref:type ISP restriction/modification enzyme n=1 Tax=Brevundimonas sp. SORGH_AS_0993 TaxID=3041794 RepID=UPI0027D901A1|nr:type ISP restriction/modification enzyme [Brevundimonas sp. SORGH_AS_0993]